MSELVAQKVLVMGVKVDDHDPAAWRQRPRGFSKRAGRIVKEVQHLVDDHEIIGVALNRRRVDVALA